MTDKAVTWREDIARECFVSSDGRTVTRIQLEGAGNPLAAAWLFRALKEDCK